MCLAHEDLLVVAEFTPVDVLGSLMGGWPELSAAGMLCVGQT